MDRCYIYRPILHRVLMKILLILTLILFIFTQDSRADDITATTKDGRDVILHDNGNLVFVKDSTNNNIAISIEDFHKTHFPADLSTGKYYDEVQLTVLIRNKTVKTIKSWSALLIVKNSFDGFLIKYQLPSGILSIKPGQIVSSVSIWRDDEFMDDDVYDKLMDYDPGNLKLSLTDIEIIQ